MSAVRVYEATLIIEKTPEGEERGVITFPEAVQAQDWDENAESPKSTNTKKGRAVPGRKQQK